MISFHQINNDFLITFFNINMDNFSESQHNYRYNNEFFTTDEYFTFH